MERVCLCVSLCNGDLYEIKLRITQNDGRVSVSVMCLTTGGSKDRNPRNPPKFYEIQCLY